MPISLVRSSTTTFMMFETPMPPTISVSTPMRPRKELNASMNTSKNWNCSVVSHIESASLSLASKRSRLPMAALSRLINSFVSAAASARKIRSVDRETR